MIKSKICRTVTFKSAKLEGMSLPTDFYYRNKYLGYQYPLSIRLLGFEGPGKYKITLTSPGPFNVRVSKGGTFLKHGGQIICKDVIMKLFNIKKLPQTYDVRIVKL